MKTYVLPILLLTISNAFMTVAWYGHLKFENKPLWLVILASWGIAFFEYCFQIPANRMGNVNGLSAGQLKVIQEVITLVVFAIFARVYLGDRLTWNYYVGFLCVFAGVFFVFYFRPANSTAAVDGGFSITNGHSVGAPPSIGEARDRTVVRRED